jgi:cardiolipin synthase
MKDFTVMSEPPKIYNEMIRDILNAKKQILLETYIYDNDEVGDKFKKVLIKKAKQGVKIKLLLDAWGSDAKIEYFKELIKLGAEVRYFREIRYFIRIFSKNHERNHRKLLIIDDQITYIGSLNITKTCLNWRELVLKMVGDITPKFIKSFMKSWELYGDFTGKKLKSIIYRDYEIINEIPSYYIRITEDKYSKLIKGAKKEIMIETPYFLPSTRLRTALSKAVEKGVKVKIIIPYNSNAKLVDILRNEYLGDLHKKGVEIYYFTPGFLHSKLMIVDNNFFLLGSSNLDYRSFIYLYEINFIGKNKDIINDLKKYFSETLSKTIPFKYEKWRRRSSFKKILELLIYRIRHYL